MLNMKLERNHATKTPNSQFKEEKGKIKLKLLYSKP